MADDVTRDVTIFIPILNRPHRISMMMEQFAGFPVLFLPDESDTESIKELERLGAWFSFAPMVKEFGCPTYSSKVNHAYGMTDTPYVLYGSDDIQPMPGWWEAARTHLETNPRVGLLGTNDTRHPLVRSGRLAVHGVLRRSYIESFGSASLPDAGPVFWEGYRHWNCDVEVSYVARSRGAFAYEPRSVLKHIDPRANTRFMDSTYKLGRSFAGEDRAKRMRRCPGWPDVVRVGRHVNFQKPTIMESELVPLAEDFNTVEAVMISCEQRVEAREATIPQFERLGIPVSVSLSPCRPAGPEQNGIASTHALHKAYSEGKHCLFLEDDIDIDPVAFSYFLNRAIEKDSVVYFYNHDKEHLMRSYYGELLSTRIMRGLPIRRDLYPLLNTRDFLNAQAIFLPYWFFAPIVESNRLQSSRTSFDVFLGAYLETVKEAAYVALPHPVWHRHDRTARQGTGAPGKQSKSFGMPWFAEGENEEVEASGDALDFRAENIFQYERLLPLWTALPPDHRGHFYVAHSAVREMRGFALTASAEKMPPDGGRTVMLVASEESTWASAKAARVFPKRDIITIGGHDAHARFTHHGYPHLVFPDYGQSRHSEPTVGFLLSRRETIARHCRFLPQLARSAAEQSLLLREPEPNGCPERIPGSGAASAVRDDEHDGIHHSTDSNKRLDGYRVAAAVLESLRDVARDWFNKHGFVTIHRSLQLLEESNVIITDDEFFAAEAIALGKPAFMMTEADALTPVSANEQLNLVDAADFIPRLLEVTK